jgi:secreted Zn-dependent insulinase-like peptidase
MGYFTKYKITFIYILSLIIIAGFSIILIFTTKENDNNSYKLYQAKKRNDNNSTEIEIKNNGLIVLKNDTEFSKPNIKMNAEFELVQLANNMTGLIISDPYAKNYQLQIMMNYGSIIDTVPGISHFGEHMIFQGSEKYNTIYPIYQNFLGIKEFILYAFTDLNSQAYFISMPSNYLMDKVFDIFIDPFRYPLYLPYRIKNEIQAVNHEFYERINLEVIELEIVRQLSNNKTSFNGFQCGNNETLKVNETESLSKILKGYHMIIKNPNNLFFVLYSNKTMNESKEYALKYLNYTMHEFPDDEIDLDDQKKLKENIYNVENIEIFDETL